MTQTRATCRLGHKHCDPKSLGQWVHCVARHSDMDARTIAERIRKPYAWFIKATEDREWCIAPGWLLLSLAALTGRTEHLAYIAREGGLVTFLPPSGNSATARTLAPIVRSFSAFIEDFEEAHADGVCDKAEAHLLRHRAHEHVAQVFARVNAVCAATGIDDDVTPAKENA